MKKAEVKSVGTQKPCFWFFFSILNGAGIVIASEFPHLSILSTPHAERSHPVNAYTQSHNKQSHTA